MSAATEHEMVTTCTTVWLVQPRAERVDVDEFPLTPCPDWCDPQRQTPLDGQIHLTPAEAVDMVERVLATVHEIDPELVECLLERHLSVGWES